MLNYEEKGKQLEDELRKNLGFTMTMNTDRSLAQLSEMLTIQDYQSQMESKFGTEAAPTERDLTNRKGKQSTIKGELQHGKNKQSFSKT